jgi:hypothetical protein
MMIPNKPVLRLFGLLLLIALTACTPVAAESTVAPAGEIEAAPTATTGQPTPTPEPTAEATAEPAPTEPTLQPQEEERAACDDPFGDTPIRFNPSFWGETNFCLHSVDYSEFLSGGPPPDGIPAIDDPVFESTQQADEWLGDQWPVMFFEWNGDARAYPLAILMWHEIANDVVGGLPVTLTFCPLCNATIAFNRTLPDGTVLDFGTSGNLRNSDLVMYDRQTFSWWQQFTGEAVVGALTGTFLELLPSQIIAWEDFRDNHPDGEVLSRDTGHVRSYGVNPYGGYDDILTNPFLFDGEVDDRLAAKERVVAVQLKGVDVAYPFLALEEVGVVNDVIAGEPVVVFWTGNTASALDSRSFDDSRLVGSTAVFHRDLDGQELTFETAAEGFRDLETGSLWNIFGKAVEGPLAGSELEQVVSAEHFWFAWAVFKPETVIWSPE